jgi:hypothetical protein
MSVLARGSRFVLRAAVVVTAIVGLTGCTSFFGIYRGWPYPEHDRTAFHTPDMRIDTVNQFATRADGTDSTEQREYTDQLARQIQIEPDPLVRTAIINAVSEFRTPLAYQILEAGLGDEHTAVRVASCEAIGERANIASVAKLTDVVRNDEDKDVRLAAVAALGKIKDPSAVAGVAVALEDRDPAMQYVGVQSMKSITGKNYGGDVDAWRQLAAGNAPPEPPAPSIAERIRDAARF